MSAVASVLVACLLWLSTFRLTTGELDSFGSCPENENDPIPEGYCPPPIIMDGPDLFEWPSEPNVAQSGHILGIKPVEYELEIKFEESKNFFGNVRILVKAVQSTSKIAINMNSAIDVDFNSIQITEKCSKTPVCLRQVQFLAENETLLIKLQDSSPLEQSKQYQIEFKSFNGSAYNSREETGSPGTYTSSGMEPSWTLGTLFQMRYARTVFPCFDHPALKAKFKLCMKHPAAWTAVENMPEASRNAGMGENEVETCFQESPLMPTYVFTFSLYHDMHQISKTGGETGVQVDLIVPGQINQTDRGWIFDEAFITVDRLTEVTGRAYVLPKLGFICVNKAPFWGIENFGHVTLEEGWVQFSAYDTSHIILVHEIVHQWLGNLFTISHWDEICLQEGLTAYLTFWLAADFEEVPSLDDKMTEIWGQAMRSDDGSSAIIQSFTKTQEIADRCYTKPSMVFHMMNIAFGNDTVKKFMKGMTEKFAYKSPGLKEWKAVFAEVTENPNAGRMLDSWFTQPGYPICEFKLRDNTLHVSQKQYVNDKVVAPTDSFVLPLVLKDSAGTVRKALLTDQTVGIDLGSDGGELDWVVLDPEAKIYTVGVYEVDVYTHLVDNCLLNYEANSTSCQFWLSELNAIFRDFCTGLIHDLFPLEKPLTESKIESFSQLFENLGNVIQTSDFLQEEGKVRLPYTCSCCLKTKPEIDAEPDFSSRWSRSCKRTWNRNCRSLKIRKALDEGA